MIALGWTQTEKGEAPDLGALTGVCGGMGLDGKQRGKDIAYFIREQVKRPGTLDSHNGNNIQQPMND